MDKAKRLDSLTSLRFFAAAAIVALHASQSFGMFDIAKYFPASQAVSFFFVLSGFILSYAYQSLDSSQKIQRFFVARFARVWPLHAVTTLIWIAMLGYWNPEGILYKDGIPKLIANIFLLQAWIPLQDWQTSLNGVSWSISVEFFFYAMFPLIISLFHKQWHLIISAIALVTIAVIASCHLTSSTSEIQPTNLLYFFPATRLLEFVAGISAFHLAKHLKSPNINFTASQLTILEIAALTTVAITMLMTRSFGVPAVLGPHAATYIKISGSFPAFAVMIIVFSFGGGAISKILTFQPLVFLGEASFALYLCHYPTLYFIEHNPDIFPSQEVRYFSAWAISISLSCVLLILVERPARRAIMHTHMRIHSRTSKKQLINPLTLAACAILTCISVVGFSFYREFNPQTIYLSDSNNIARFEYGPEIHRIRILKKYSDYSILEIETTNKSEKTGVQLAVHLNNESGRIEKNLIPSTIKRTFSDETSTVSLVVNNKDLEITKTIALAAYYEGAPLLRVQSVKTDWGERRAVFELEKDENTSQKLVQ